MNDTSFEPSVFWPSDTESRIKELRFSDSISLSFKTRLTGPRSAVGNVSGNRCESDCRSRGREFDPGPVPYFPGD